MTVVKPKRYKYWQIVISKNGKRHWISSGTEDKLEAQKKELEMLIVLRKRKEEIRFTEFIEKVSSQKIERKGVSVESAWSAFLTTPKAERKERTLKGTKIIWEKFKDWLCDRHPEVEFFAEISRDITIEYCKRLKDSGIASQTYNNHRNALRGMFKGLMYLAEARENPWDITSSAARDTESYRIFSEEEITKIKSKCLPEWKIAVDIALYTGLRFIDVAHLEWDSIDLEKKIITLKPEKTVRFSKILVIPVHCSLLKLFEGLTRTGDYVLPSIARNYSNKQVRNYFGDLLAECNITDNDAGIVGFHSLRHTFVTRLESAGITRDIRQKLVGHGSPMMTDIYSHALEPLREALAKIK